MDVRVYPESLHGFTSYPTAMAAAVRDITVPENLPRQVQEAVLLRYLGAILDEPAGPL